MFTLIGNILACVLWGVFISVTLVVFLYWFLRLLHPNYSLTIPGVLIGLFLQILLFAQSVMLIGAVYAKGYADKMKITEQFQQEIGREYPMIQSCLNKIDVEDIVDEKNATISIINEIKSLINYYILRRVLWIVGFMISGVIILILCRPKTCNYYSEENWELE